MAVSARNARQIGSIFQNKLENLGGDLGGDHLAAFRANYHLQLARAASGTGGELAGQAPATGGAFVTDGSIGPISGFTIAANVYGASGQFSLSAVNAQTLGLDFDDPSWAKLHNGLAEMFVEAQLSIQGLQGAERDAALGRFVSEVPASLVAAGYVAIDAVARDGNGAALLDQLNALGMVRGASFGAMAGGFIAIDRLDELAQIDQLGFARPVLYETHAGSVQSQNVASMNVDYLHNNYGLTGAGISIGFISDSFNTATLTTQNTALSIHYAQDVASGDLPAGVNILEDGTGSSVRDEGRAMAQLAYDVAPGINVLFHTALPSMANFAQGIIDLYNAGADIIVDDVRYFTEPFFQDGIIAQAVDTVVAGGAMYFSSAGNQATASYESVYRASDQTINITGSPAVAGTYRFHDFDPGAGQDFVQSFTKTGSAAASYVLNWDNPSLQTGGLGATADLAIIIFNAAGTPIAAFSSNNVGADAIEFTQNASTTWAGFAIGVREGPGFAAPTYVKTSITGSVTINEWNTNSGTSYGHSNANGAISVGASDWVDSGRFAAPYVAGEPMPYLETFSSRGDVPIFFDVAGNRYAAPQYRSNVDFTAGDGGNNTFFGSDNPNSGAYAGFEADTSPNFYGTSAAAPNAAAVAALLMAAYPTATRDQIETALERSAIDIQVTYTGTQIGDGYDNRAGYGLIQADRAYQLLGAMLNADTVVQAGEVALVSYETDTSAGGTPDALRFVLLSDVAQGTTIYISDRTWNGSAFAAPSAGEGTYAWTAGSAMTAGTVITLSAAQLATGGVTLSNNGETLYFYQGGQDLPTRFLFAADIADGNATFNGSLAGTGLTAGTNAVAVSLDNALWQGTATGLASTTLASIANSANWYSSDQDDIAGTTGYTEVTDTTVNSSLNLDGNDFVIIAGFAGGGQSDGIIRVGAEDGASTFQNLARLFRDHPQITRIEDVSLDLESGFFFFADTDGNSINRIMRGNIADLVSGNQNATFTQIFATDGQNNGAGPVLPGEIINGIEVDRVNNHIYWWDGDIANDFEGGWQLNRANYDGTGLTTIALLDTENSTSPAPFNGIADWALDLPRNFAYVISTISGVDGLGNATVYTNHIARVNLSTGVITVLALDAADPRSSTGGGAYNDGRLDPTEGQIYALDVDTNTGIVYFITQPISGTNNGGVWSYNPATDDLQELWNQPTPNSFNTLQTFPTGNMTDIEVDEIGGRIWITTSGSIDHENDATPGTNEHDASIYSLAIGATAGTAPTRFVRIYEPTALGSPLGMEINYDSNVALTTNNATYTESTNGPGSPAGPVVTPFTNATITDPDNTSVYGAQVAITSGFVSGDTLSFTNSGGITGSYNSATGVVTFTGLATLAQYQTVLNSIRFTNAGDNPTDYGNSTTRVISANVFDGLTWGDLTSVSLTVVGINDAPVNVVPGAQAASEDTGKVISGLSVSDPDADPANQLITVTLHANHGTITIFTNAGGGVTIADVTGNGTGTVTITATQNAINATFAHASGVTYLNTLDYNGVDTLTITTSDNGLNGTDPGLTGTGTSEQDQDTVTINIAAVNDAPQVVGDGTEDSITILEDQPSAVGQTVNALFSGQYSDQRDNQIPNGGASSPGAFSGIAVIGNGSSAGTGNWQYFDTGTSTWVNIGARTASTALLIDNTTALRFNPAANYNGPEPLLTVRLIDNSLGFGINFQQVDLSSINSYGGTTAYSVGTVTLGGMITAVNDAPTSTSLQGDSATWTEAGPAVLLDVGANATIADIDSTDFDGGTLTVAITAGGVPAEDQLGIDTSGTVTVAGNAVLVGGVQIATFTGGGAGGAPLVFTLDPDATPAAVQALVRAINYSNSGGVIPTEGARTVTWTLVDGDGTANGGQDTLTVTSSVNVLSVNSAPSGTDNMLSLNEDGTRVLTQGNFGFSDSPEGNAFAGVVITTLPTDGELRLNGVAITVAGTFVSATDINSGLLAFVPDANENGSPYASFTFQVRDNGGTANGGQDTDQTPNTMTFNVDPVNDAPTSTNLSGDAATWIEGSSAVQLDVGSNATIADIDSMNFDGGSLTVTLTGGNVAQDGLFITATGGVTFDATTVSVGGIQIATYTGGGYGGGNLVFTFDPDATPAAVQALVRALAYNNNGGISPTTGVRSVTWTFVDGDGTANGGGDTLIVGSTVDVQAINDAPAGTDNTYTINEDTNYVFTAGSFGFSDVNNDAFAGVVVTTIPVPGTLMYDADGAGGAAAVAVTAGQFISASDIALGHLYLEPGADLNGNPYTSFTFQVRDNGGTANGGTDTDQSANTLTFNVTAVNDAPTITAPVSVLMNEDGSQTFSGGIAIQVADVDATTLTVTLSVAHGTLTLASLTGLSFGTGDGTADATMTFSGTISAINTALNTGLTYNPTANYNGTDAISISVTDNGQTGTGGAQVDSDSIAITINSVNDAPSGTDNTVTGSEDDPYVFTLADFGFSDPVEGNAFLAIRINSFPANGALMFDPDGPGGAAPVNLAGVGVGVFVGAADIAAGHLYFQPDPDEYGDGYASFLFQVQDDGGTANGGVDLDPTNNTITIDIEPDNLPPVVDLDGGTAGVDYTTTFVEDGAPVAIGSGIIVSDPDAVPLGDMIEGAVVTLTDRVAGDSLVFSSPLPSGFTAIFTSNATSITIEIFGTGTQAQYASLLQSVVYSTTSQDPDVGGTDTSRTITVTVDDGDIDSAVATTTINIAAVDDLPVAQPDYFTITESGTIVNASLFADNGSGADSDPDGPPLSISAVNGSAGNVGSQITLGSGALLTVNANGTFSYDPNGAFLPTPTAGSGASNTPAHDGFTYTLAGGNTVSVFITLTGLDTDDYLLGTAGNDVLMGGLGNDTYIVGNTADQVIEAAGQGFDSVFTSVSYALAAGSEIEWLAAADETATTSLALVGNGFAQYLVGNDGANIFSGGGGADIMIGHDGNDTYYVTDAATAVEEAAGEGFDAVYSSVSYTLTAGSEVEWLSTINVAATTAINLTGNAFGNYVIGNAGMNILDGGAGADLLYGYGGHDTYRVDNAGDQVFESVGNGFDSVYVTTSWALGAGQEVEWLSTADVTGTANINITGNEFVNYIVGNAGNNVLNGGGGADFLYGYGGNDIYLVTAGTLVFESAGGGNDSVVASTSYTLNNGAEVEFLGTNDSTATTAIDLTGNELDNVIYGNAGSNVLDGKGGNDVLFGLAGADTFAFTTALGANNVDIILDFTHNVDRIALDDAIFTALGGPGSLNANAFVVGAAAADAADRIIYNNLTGQLFYDADGNGAGAAVLFANLNPGLTVTASDFIVI